MADGEINRNGATIRIDENGGVQVEPADGQEVEYTGPDRGTDAIRNSVKTEEGSIDVLTSPVSRGRPDFAPNQLSRRRGRQIENFQDESDLSGSWGADDTDVSLDSSTTYNGLPAVRLDGADNTGTTGVSVTYDTAIDLTNERFSVAFKADSPDGVVAVCTLILDDIDGNRAYYRRRVHYQASPDWIRTDLPIWEGPGGVPDAFDFSNVDTVSLRTDFGDDNGYETAWFADLRGHEKPDKGELLFTFDDANESDYTVAYPVLAEFGYVGTSFIMPDAVGDDGNLTLDQMIEMRDAGWCISSHMWDHESLNDLSKEEQLDNLERTREWLAKNGFRRGARFHRTTYGDWDDNALETLPQVFDLAFTGQSGVGGCQVQFTESRLIGMQGGNDFKEAKDVIDRAANNTELVGLTIHGISDESGFRDLVSYADDYVASGDLEIVTPDDLLVDLGATY